MDETSICLLLVLAGFASDAIAFVDTTPKRVADDEFKMLIKVFVEDAVRFDIVDVDEPLG